MPVQSSVRHLTDQMPSFSTIYEEAAARDEDTATSHERDATTAVPEAEEVTSSARMKFVTVPHSPLHFKRNSNSTLASDSAASSPITIASLADSQTSNDTPGLSPETPQSAQSLSSPVLISAMRASSPQHPASSEIKRASPPNRKPRNLKNLGIDTSGAQAFGRGMSSATLPLQRPQQHSPFLNGPESPSFIRPPQPPSTRKSSNLGLKIITPSTEDPVNPVLQRPTFQLRHSHTSPNGPTLRHHVSTPVLPVASPHEAPAGGMQLPPIATRTLEIPGDFSLDETDNNPIGRAFPHSAEDEAYPDGPVCIYDPHIFLGSEPTVEQARDYDVIFNVASEVRNPFENASSDGQSSSDPSSGSSDNVVLERPTKELSTVFSVAASSGTVTKSSDSIPPRNLPEYIHIFWEHNTDIVPDLHDLVREIHSRVKQQKRVLVHCQQGVSRSASLIVAYGIYQNPSMSVQDAYDAVKERSQWISPNMNLIMQLQEFRSGLLRRSAGLPVSFGFNKKTYPSLRHARGSSASAAETSPADFPSTAPLFAALSKPPQKPVIVVPSAEDIQPGPFSAPSSVHWAIRQRQSSGATTGTPARQQSLDEKNSISSQPENVSLEMSVQQTVSQEQRKVDRRSHVPVPINTKDIPVETDLATMSGNSFEVTSAKPRADSSNFTPDYSLNRNAYRAVDDTLMSPRAEHFAMSSIYPRLNDDGLGLTSPRHSTIAPEVRLTVQARQMEEQAPSKEGKRIVPILPPDKLSEPTVAALTKARGTLKSKLGMSTRSNYDMRSDYANAAHARSIQPVPLSIDTDRQSSADTVLSPRTTEFTRESIHEALLHDDSSSKRQSRDQPQQKGNVLATMDPRSPPQPGSEVQIQNIMDVL